VFQTLFRKENAMKKLAKAALVILPLAAGGVVLAASQAKEPKGAAYTCPLTGESLPCPFCCPLNKGGK
jgi:hypothetical protein